MIQKLSRGDVYYYDFGYNRYDGSVEGKNRPVVVVSNDKGNNYGTTCIVAPITTRDKSSCKSYQAFFKNANRHQIVLCEQLRVVNIKDLTNYQGHLDELTMKEIDKALAIELDLIIKEKELDNIEWLKRLDISFKNIITNNLHEYDSQLYKNINTHIDLAIKTIVKEQNKLHNDIMKILINKIDDKLSINDDILNETNNIKNLFNKNSEMLDKVLSSMINLFKNVNNSSNNISNDITDIDTKNDIERELKSFNDIDDTLDLNNQCETVEYKKQELSNKNNKHINRRNVHWQPKINYDNIDELLSFIDECNNNDVEFICNKYNLTKKQLSNRKYLISKSLKNRNIPVTIIRHIRKGKQNG